jgi:hypothetical protein
MRPLGEVAGEWLHWMGTGAFSREYHLRDKRDLFATLRVGGWLGRRIGAESSEGRWTLRRGGLFGRKVLILEAESDREIAGYEGGWLGRGTLTFADGRTFHWRRLGFWNREWGFMGEDGEPVLRIASERVSLRARARLMVEPSARAVGGLSTMAVLGFYLMLRRRAHVAAAS